MSVPKGGSRFMLAKSAEAVGFLASQLCGIGMIEFLSQHERRGGPLVLLGALCALYGIFVGHVERVRAKRAGGDPDWIKHANGAFAWSYSAMGIVICPILLALFVAGILNRFHLLE